MTEFDPSQKARDAYKASGMSLSKYSSMKYSWLKQQAAKEGKEYRPGYIPEGYSQIWSMDSGQNPNVTYWKPDAYATHRADLPMADWDKTKDIQNYWHNPANVVSWHETFRVQDKDWTPPDYVDKTFVENQYKALKDFNDDNDDPLYWKPLPIGHEAAYQTNFGTDPNGDTPIYRQVIDQMNSPEMINYRWNEYQRQYNEEVKKAEEDRQKQAEKLQADMQAAPDDQARLDLLKDKVIPEYYNSLKAEYQARGTVALDDGTFATPKTTDAQGNWNTLYPWEKGYATFASQAATPGRPEGNKNFADTLAAVMPGVAIWSVGNQIAAAVGATGAATAGGVAAVAGGFAATGVGLPVAAAILLVAGALAVGTTAYMVKNKNNTSNTPVQKIFQYVNMSAEALERGYGALKIGEELAGNQVGVPNMPGMAGWKPLPKDFDWSAAYDAGYVTDEMLGAAGGVGDFMLDSLSVAAEGVDVVGKAFGKDWKWSSGKTTGDGEVWLLDEGFAEPQTAKVPIGKKGLLVAYDAMKALGDNRTRDQMTEQWAYLTALTGSAGTLNDYVMQNLFDLNNLVPYLSDVIGEKAATIQARKYVDIGEPTKAAALTALAKSFKEARGNPLIDALPMGVQQVAAKWLEGFSNYAEFKLYGKMGLDLTDLPSILKPYDSKSVADAVRIYNAKMATGYGLPSGNEFLLKAGAKVEDILRFKVEDDGGVKITNVDGTMNWVYDANQLRKLGVEFKETSYGTLNLKGVKKLLADAKINTQFAKDVVETGISWKDPKNAPAEIINAENAYYGADPENPDKYIVQSDGKSYVLDKRTELVEKIIAEDGTETVPDKPMRFSERAVYVGDEVFSGSEGLAVLDLVTMTSTGFKQASSLEFMPNDEVKNKPLQAKLRSLDNKVINTALDWYTSLSEITPGNKAMIEVENLKESILLMYYFSGNNVELTLNAIKKMIGNADVRDVTKAASQFIGQAGTVAAVMGSMKAAFGDGTMADAILLMYKESASSRAFIAKISKNLGVEPEKLIEMKPEDILTKLKNKVSANTDPVSTDILKQINDGTLSAKSIKELIEPFTGKKAMPLTNEQFLAQVTMYADKAAQDFLIEKYGVKKLDTWTRLSNAKKAFLAPLLITTPYTQWVNNLYNNLGTQFFLEGVAPIHGKNALNKVVAQLGMDALPWSIKDYWGLAAMAVESTSKIALTLNPNDSIGKVTRAFRKIGGIVKAYSAIERTNAATLFIAQVKDLHRRIQLTAMPENIKAEFRAVGINDQQQQMIWYLFNRQMSPEGIKDVATNGVEYDALSVGLFDEVGEKLGGGNPDAKNIIVELMHKVGADEEFMAEASKLTDPKDLPLLREKFNKAIEKQIYMMLDESVRATNLEVENIMTKEGMAGGIGLMAHAIYGELAQRTNIALDWGEAWLAADQAAKAGDYDLRNSILRNQRMKAEASYRRFNAMQETVFNAMVNHLKPTDGNGKAFSDLVASRHKVAAEILEKVHSNYEDYFDRVANNKEGNWDNVISKNEALMARLDKTEVETLKKIAKLWGSMMTAKIASNVAASGVSATDLKRGANAMMKKLITGYENLNKMRTQHYADIKDLSGTDRRVANIKFWDEKFIPTLNQLEANFSDDNWKNFFTSKTNLEKSMYPTPAEPEVPAAPEAPKAPVDAALEDINNRISEKKLKQSRKKNANAVHVEAGAEHTKLLWFQELERATMPEKDRLWADIFISTLDEVYSAREGKPAGSWLTAVGEVAVKEVQDTVLHPKINEKLEVAAMTTWNENAKRFDILVSQTHNATTFIQETFRVVLQTPLIPDVDKAILVKKFGNISLDAYKQIENKVNVTHTATDAEVDLWRKINNDSADAYKIWLYDEAPLIAPTPELHKAFTSISKTLSALVKHIQGKMPDFKVDDDVRGVFRRLHFVGDTDEIKTRNVVRLAKAPTGKSVSLFGTINAKKQYKVTAKLVDLDDVLSSHHLNTKTEHFDWSDMYDRSLQQRIRGALVNEMEIKRWANPNEFNPLKLILDFHNLSDGAPIIDGNMQVLSGNGRTLMLEYARFKYPESWGAYQTALKAEAKGWGFTDADFEGIDNPVLVMKMEGDYDPMDFIVDANKPAQAAMSQYETALTHVNYIDNDVVGRFEFSADNNLAKSLLLEKNNKLVQAIMSKIPDTKPYIDPNTGGLTPSGITTLSFALFAKVFDTDSGRALLQTMINNPDTNIKNLLNGMINALPQLSKLSAKIADGTIPSDLLPTELIAFVARRVSDLKGSKIGLDEYLARGEGLFAGAADTDVQKKFVTYIMEHSRSSKAITDLLVEYANQALKETTGEKFVETNVMTTAEDAFGKALDIANKNAIADDLEIGTLKNFAKRAAESSLVLLDDAIASPLKAKLEEMLDSIKKKPKIAPEWMNTYTINEAGYPEVTKMLKSMLGADDTINPLRTQILAQAWDSLMRTSDDFQRATNAINTPEGIEAKANQLDADVDDIAKKMNGSLFQKAEEVLPEDYQQMKIPMEGDQLDIFGNLVAPKKMQAELGAFDKIQAAKAQELVELRKRAELNAPVHVVKKIDDTIVKIDQMMIDLDEQIAKVDKIVEKTEGLYQLADEAEAADKDWYYLQSEVSTRSAKQNRMSAGQWRNILSGSGVTKSEMKWLELDKLFEINKSPTKDDLLSWIGEHKLVIEEVEKKDSNTKWSRFALPGGTDYREILIRLPGLPDHNNPHWAEKNVIAHIRFDTRIDPATGKVVLNLLEVQSDWLQNARRWGFEGDAPDKLRSKMKTKVDALEFHWDSEDEQAGHLQTRKGKNYSPIYDGTIYKNQNIVNAQGINARNVIADLGTDTDYTLFPDAFESDLNKYSDLVKRLGIKREDVDVTVNNNGYLALRFQLPDGELLLNDLKISYAWNKQYTQQIGDTVLDFLYDGTKEVSYEVRTYNTFNDHLRTYSEFDAALSDLKSSTADAFTEDVIRRRPPQAPFEDFNQLALKRMLRYAVDNNYDELSFSTGTTAAEIEGHTIIKDVAKIEYNPEDWQVIVHQRGGGSRMFDLDDDNFTLERYIGQDVASAVNAVPTNSDGWKVFDVPENFVFGGDKMRGWYDEIMVDEFNAYLKKMGWKASLEDGNIELAKMEPLKKLVAPSRPGLTEAEFAALDRTVNIYTTSFEGRLVEVLWPGDHRTPELNAEIAHNVFADPNAPPIWIENYPGEIVKAETPTTPTRTVHTLKITPEIAQDVVSKRQPLFQKAEEARAAVPLTEYPVGSSPIHNNAGSALDELYQMNISRFMDEAFDTLGRRMSASERPKYSFNLTPEQAEVMTRYMKIAMEEQRLRMATVLSGSKLITKDIMLDYAKRRGIDQLVEMAFPYQFWYTRTALQWLKRGAAKPAVAAALWRYRELQRRNELTGYPSRLAGKSPVYAPWLPKGFGDTAFVDPLSKSYGVTQVMQPIVNITNLDAELTETVQRYIIDLLRSGEVSAEDAKAAITTKSGKVWNEALGYVKVNSMDDKTDPFAMASLVLNPDPVIGALYYGLLKKTPEKISPLPPTRIGNSMAAVGGDSVLGVIGSIMAAPENAIRDVAGLPRLGEWGDYYPDFWLANMAADGQINPEDAMNAMISRSGAAWDKAYAAAQEYIALRTPGTSLALAIKHGERDPNTLASAFLMSFLPMGVFPEGEMIQRGLKDKYQQAWEDYERGDQDALKNFNDEYPEYKLRQAMFKEPKDRFRGHMINLIWDKYYKLPSVNRKIMADELGDAFKAYFLEEKTRNYEAVDEGTLTMWARKLGAKVPSTPATQKEATQTIEPTKLYPEDTAAIIQTFIDERNTKFPDYWLYQGIYMDAKEDQKKKILKGLPMLKDYWDWKDEQAKANPVIKNYLDSLKNENENYDTEYDVQLANEKLANFDTNLLQQVIASKILNESLSEGTLAELNSLFVMSGKPGGDFKLWLKVLLGE